MAQLWGGRFTKETDQLVYNFNASITFDKRFYKQDIRGSLAHVAMLAKQGILTEEEKEQITDGLNGILKDVESGKLEISDKYEDIKSSAATMLIVGGVGLVLMALIIAKVIILPISAETSWLFYSVMGGVFIIFVIAGIVSFMHAKQVKIEAAEEDKLIDSINTWANDNLKISDLDQGLDLSQPDEILFFSRAERIKKALMMEFENADEPLIDELTEQIFHTLYEE